MTIHTSHPFPTDDDPARRLRGRLGGAVALWTTGAGASRAGLTVTSMLVALGEPARLVALVDPDSELADEIVDTETAVCHLLGWSDRDLADAFAGVTPAPGGAFRLREWEQTTWGPRLVGAGSGADAGAVTWAGVRLESAVDVGWSRQLTCVVEQLEVGDDDPMTHRRGRYHR